MVALIVTMREGETRTVDAAPGATVMEAIRDGGIDELLAICGGCLSCATCHVYVDPAHLDRLEAISEDESDLLDAADNRQANSRLSCQIRLDGPLAGLRVTIAPDA